MCIKLTLWNGNGPVTPSAQKNITTSYRKSQISNKNWKTKIDCEVKEIAYSMNLGDRIDCMAEKDAFITLQDHKDNFQNN